MERDVVEPITPPDEDQDESTPPDETPGPEDEPAEPVLP